MKDLKVVMPMAKPCAQLKVVWDQPGAALEFRTPLPMRSLLKIVTKGFELRIKLRVRYPAAFANVQKRNPKISESSPRRKDGTCTYVEMAVPDHNMQNCW